MEPAMTTASTLSQKVWEQHLVHRSVVAREVGNKAVDQRGLPAESLQHLHHIERRRILPRRRRIPRHDPTLDVSGRDAAQKLALLASLAFNVGVSESDIHVEGIDTIQPTDIQFARDLGYVIKLLAIAERADSKVALRVHPTLVHEHDVLADVGGSFNAISVYGHALGHGLWYGRGAGRTPTASAVVADLIGVAMGVTPLAFKQLNILPDQTRPALVLPFDQLTSRYYLRLMCKDQPGVLAQITRILGDHKVSVASIRQHEMDETQFVPVIITTHLASEGPMQTAVKTIDALDTIAGPSVCLRIIDQPKEFGAR